MGKLMSNNTLLWGILALVIAIGVAFMVTPETAYAGNPGKVKVEIGDEGLDISGGGFSNGSDSSGAWNDFIEKYRDFIVGVSGVAAVTMIVLFIVQFLRLGSSAGNPQARSQALVGLLWTGIAAAGLGAVTIFVGFFYNAFGG